MDRELEKRRDPPTQVARPWRAALRTAVAGAVGFIPVGIAIARELELDSVPFFAGAITLGITVSRVLSVPQVELFLREHAPWLAAQPANDKGGKRRLAGNPNALRVEDLLDPDAPNT